MEVGGTSGPGKTLPWTVVVGGKDAVKFLDVLDKQLADSTYIAGESFSIADIIALCAIDFARVVKIRIGEEQTHLQRWYKLVSERPSAGI
ncbi:MAG: hypothetical protein CL586_03955 [Alteromonadaceae bacterium]|nr:hypothetical protein [Alteromonadaceae bacterium]